MELNNLSEEKLRVPKSLHPKLVKTYLNDARYLDDIVFNEKFFETSLNKCKVTSNEEQLNPEKRFSSDQLHIIGKVFEALTPLAINENT